MVALRLPAVTPTNMRRRWEKVRSRNTQAARKRSARRQRDDSRFHQIAEIGKSRTQQPTVRTGVEGHFLVLGESPVRENLQSAEVAVGWHVAGFAVKRPNLFGATAHRGVDCRISQSVL